MVNEAGIEVVAEVEFKEEGRSLQSFLLGADNQLYLYNGGMHSVRPFSELAKYPAFNLPHPIDYIIQKSRLTLRNKSVVDGAEYYRTVIQKNKKD